MSLKMRFFTTASALMVYAGVIFLSALIGVVTWTVVDARHAAYQQEIEAQSNLSLGLERDVRRAIEVLDLSLQSAAHGMEMPGIHTMDPDFRQAVLFDGAIKAEGFSGAFITNATGDFLYDSIGSNRPNFNIADRPFFQAHMANPNLGLTITPPFASRTGSGMKLGLVRRYNQPDGSFGGVVIGVIGLDYIQSLASPLQLGQLGIVSVFNTDAVLIAHKPYVAQDIGKMFTQNGLLDQFRQNPIGVFTGNSVLDGVERMYTYRQVGQFPLIVTIGHATQDVFADWNQKTTILISIMGLLVLIGLCLAGLLQRELLRRGRAERAAKYAQMRHAEALAHLDALFHNSDDSMLVARLAPNGQFVYEAVNPIWEQMTGVPAALALGRAPTACLPPPLGEIVGVNWQQAAQTHRPVIFAFDMDLNGATRSWEAKIVPVVAADNQVTRLIAVARDVTLRKAAEDQLARLNEDLAAQATTDSLTGLANRRRLDDALAQEWRRAARDRSPLSMIMIDLDRFKLYNDRYGHQQGDACLQATARVLSAFVRRPGDLAARYGGEELAILLPKTDAPQAAIVAERMRVAIEAAEMEHAGNLPFGVVTASIGVSTFRPFASTDSGVATQLVAAADAALYEAKHCGRNQVKLSAVAINDPAARVPQLSLVGGKP
ncbi:diguanylate cyclase [Acidisphaera sp. L21]|uniref:sensor domain-containing diguanylate cyclase n=1 Tax=Acidisphaera sp. L21 TaxID=1641851 RepID=UPI00131E8BBA|nr:diguanylate cyclase [Acidisphaera sp. L21]